MKPNYKTLEGRLEIYKTALEYWNQDIDKIDYQGFCLYFAFHTKCTYEMIVRRDHSFHTLPELYVQRMESEDLGTFAEMGWHYPPAFRRTKELGVRLRRIALIAAIELTESQINKQTKHAKREK